MKFLENKTARAVIRYTLLAMMSILIGVGFYFLNAETLNAGDLPMPFGRGMAVVLSGSMEPALYENDLIVVSEAEEYFVGDVVVYYNGSELIVHRIISVDSEGDTVITQGDANQYPDEPIHKAAILGKVTGRVRYLGGLIRVIKQPICLFLIPVAALLLLEYSYKKEKSKGMSEVEAIKEEIRRLRDENNGII